MKQLFQRTSIAILHSQRGFAILIALLIMTVLATMASTAIATHWAQQTGSSTIQTNMQHGALLVAAQQWGHAMLIEDARDTDIDALNEVWATPKNDTSLASFLSFPGDTGSEELTGAVEPVVYNRIEDLTGKWNILSLRRTIGQSQHQILSRKIALDVGIDPERFIQLAAAAPPEYTSDWIGSSSTLRSPQDPQACLMWLGLSAKEIVLTKDLITCLPDETPLNINTVSPKFFKWLFESGVADDIIKERDKQPFQSISDAAQRVKVPESTFSFFFFGNPSIGWSVKSNWFAIHTQVTIGGISWGSTQTVHRLGTIVQVINTIPVF